MWSGAMPNYLLRVRQDEQEFFAWLPITDLNKAAWRGETVHTIRLDTHFSPTPAPPTPTIRVRTEGSLAHLSWQPVAGANSYNLYRALWPEYTPFASAATTLTETTFTVPLTRTARFALTAMFPDGSESVVQPARPRRTGVCTHRPGVGKRFALVARGAIASSGWAHRCDVAPAATGRWRTDALDWSHGQRAYRHGGRCGGHAWAG